MLAKILLALFLTLAVEARANLVTNGDFESPVLTTPYHLYAVGSTAITGWTVVGAGDIHNTSASLLGLPASTGNQWIDLTGIFGYDKGLVSDAVATVIGSSYRLKFDIGDYRAAGFGNSTVGVTINFGNEGLFTNVMSVGSTIMDWKTFTLDFVATSQLTQITFMGRANGLLSNNAGIGLDNVVLVELPSVNPNPPSVPLPGIAFLLALGLATIGRKRTRA